MRSIKNIISLAFQNIGKWRGNHRIYFIAVYVICFTAYANQNIALGCRLFEGKIAQWLFPFQFTYPIATVLFTTPFVLLFCDAPFLDDTQPYIIVRCKRHIWVLGQILYVVIASFLISLYSLAASVITNIGNIKFIGSNSWGPFIETTNINSFLAQDPRGYFFIREYITSNFTPLQAMWFSFLYFWLAAMFIGLLMFCLNSVFNSRIVGGVCAGFMVMMGYIGISDPSLARFSPLSWISLEAVDVGGQTNNPSFMYTMIFYAVVFAVLLTVILIQNRKRTIEVLPPV